MEKRKSLRRICPIHFYRTEAGVVPFKKWYERLDASVRARIFLRFERIEYYGDWGSFKMLRGKGVLSELKFNFGPGYRVYCRPSGGGLLILLGGDKSSQRRDIKFAQEYYQDYVSQICISGGNL